MAWYTEKLGCRIPSREEIAELEPDEPAAAILALPADFPIGVYFYRDKAGMPQSVPVLFTGDLPWVRGILSERAVSCSTIQRDRSGRQYFEVRDPDGNLIEVCQED